MIDKIKIKAYAFRFLRFSSVCSIKSTDASDSTVVVSRAVLCASGSKITIINISIAREN